MARTKQILRNNIIDTSPEDIKLFKDLMKSLPKYIDNEQKKIKSIDYGLCIYNLYNDYEKMYKKKGARYQKQLENVQGTAARKTRSTGKKPKEGLHIHKRHI